MVTTTKQGDVVLFWHPEKKMPFELSKPMPRNQQALAMVIFTAKTLIIFHVSVVHHFEAAMNCLLLLSFVLCIDIIYSIYSI